MKYVLYDFTFNNGVKQEYTLEIEPHEVEEYKNRLNDTNTMIHESMRRGVNGVVRLNTTVGQVYIKLSELLSVAIQGLEDLQDDSFIGGE